MVDKPNNNEATKVNKKKDNMQQSQVRPDVSDLIGQRLRSFYDDVSKQPVPDRFLDLLKKLETVSPPDKKP